MEASVRGHVSVLALNTKLYLNCLDAITDEEAARRPNERTNHITFLALHVLDARSFMARYLGLEHHHPFEPETAGITGIDDLETLPSLEELRGAWRAVAAVLEPRLRELDEPFLDEISDQAFPVDDDTRLGGLAFLLHHESYHIGQMALARKFLGHEAMTYVRPASA